jgi:O-antigen/teichoic acid export membrane protein
MTGNKFHSPIERQSSDAIDIQAGLLAKNTIFSLLGQGLPLFVAVISLPFLIRGLGLERFGILSLAWAVLGYFNIFDLGLGRAATKYIAEAFIKRDQKRVSAIVWTSVHIQTILGILGALILASLIPFFIEHVLNIPLYLRHEASTSFYFIATSLPFVFITGSFRGMLEASQRFDIVNAIKIPFSSGNFLLPLFGMLIGWNLPGIIVLLVVSRCLATFTHYWACIHFFPYLKIISYPNVKELKALISFGGWVTLSNLSIPAIVYLDRFLIASLLVISDLSYYTAPYEVINRLVIIPLSFVSVLFPAFSTLSSSGTYNKLIFSFTRSTKYLMTIMVPPILFFLLFAEEILRHWLGNDFVIKSTDVFRFLTLAIMLNTIGYIPSALIQGVGRPDIIAKLHLIELPLYASVAFIFIKRLGINGAALSWCLRMGVTMPILFFFSIKIGRVPLKTLSKNSTFRSLIINFGFVLSTILLFALNNFGLIIKTILFITFIISHSFLVLFFSFDDIDKELLLKMIRKFPKIKGV